MNTDVVPEWWYVGPSARERPSSHEDDQAVTTDEVLRCPVTDTSGGDACGEPAKRYPLPLGVSHIACPKHRLQFLALLSELHATMEGA